MREGREVFCDGSDNLWSLVAVRAFQASSEKGGEVIDVKEYARSLGLALLTAENAENAGKRRDL